MPPPPTRLVFDAEYPEVFAAYCKKQDALVAKFRKPWSIKVHRNLPSSFRAAVHTVLLSGERFSRHRGTLSTGSGDCNSTAGTVVLVEGDSSSDDGGGPSLGGNDGCIVHEVEEGGGDAGAGAAAGVADAVAEAPGAEAAVMLLLLPPELWEKIFGFLVRGDWKNDRHDATGGSPPLGKSKPSKKHKFKERNGKA